MTRTWEDCDDRCLPHVFADVSLHELQQVFLIKEVPGHPVSSDVPTCDANATVPFGVCPDCGSMHGSL